jgi:hypothetical protein
MAGEAIQLCAKARFGVRALVIVVPRTFGGFLNFHSHLHAWSQPEACKNRQIVGSIDLFGQDLMDVLKVQYNQPWHVFIGGEMSTAHFLEYAGRYIRRPPIARHRLDIVNDKTVKYLGKDTNQKFRWRRFSIEKFLHILMQHVPDVGRHGMRYFGLFALVRSLAPRLLFSCCWDRKNVRNHRGWIGQVCASIFLSPWRMRKMVALLV